MPQLKAEFPDHDRSLSSRFPLPIWQFALASAVIVGAGLFSWRLPPAPDGRPSLLTWLLVMVGLAMAIVVITWRSRWQLLGPYVALALLAQSCSLMMIDAPNYGVLQHYRSWRDLLTSSTGLLVVGPLSQTILIIAQFRQVRRFFAPLGKLLSPVRPGFLIAIIVLTFAAANLSRDVLRYAGEVLLAGWISIANLGNLALVATAIPSEHVTAMQTWSQRIGRTRAKRDWSFVFPWSTAVWAVVVSAILSKVVLEGIPHIPDSVAYLFNAKYFAAGRLYLPAPPDASAFELPFVMNDGVKWYSYAFPGWPAVLAMGVLTGFPWLVNPILAGGTIVIAYNWLKRLYDRRTASCVILLLAVSPWFLFMSANLMTHTSSLFWGSLALSAACRFPTKRKLRAVLVGGFSLGMVFLTRPLEGLILGSAVGIWMLSIGKRRELILISAVAILVGSLSLVNNTLLTGKATYFPMEKYFDTHWYPGANGIGFGPNKGNVGWEHIDPLPGHGLLDVIVNANQNFFLLNFETFGWGFGSLLIALFFLYLRSWRRADKLMILILVAVIAGNSLYFFSGGPEYGARYWYLVLIPLTVLTVRSIHTLQKRWQERGGTQQPMLRVSVLLAVASLLTLVTFMPWRSIGKYYHLRGMRDDLGRWARSCTTDDALVFVQEQDKSDYPSAAIFNPLTLDETGPIFARDAGPVSREAVVSKFPDRPIWIVAGSAILGGQFTILEGPRSDLVGLSASLAAKRCA